MVSLREFISQYGSESGFALVEGKGIPEGTKIGMGLVKVLADIPEKGVDLSKLSVRNVRGVFVSASAESTIKWISEDLAQANLTEKTQDEVYRRTQAADNADYDKVAESPRYGRARQRQAEGVCEDLLRFGRLIRRE